MFGGMTRALVALATLISVSEPVLAQTVLTGSAVNNAGMPRLIRQEPSYDRPVARMPLRTGTTRVVTQRPVIQRVYVRDERSYWQRHPKVKSAAVGAGVGTAAGAVTGLIAGKGVVRGGLIGAGTGAGVGLVRSSRTMKRHPIAKDAATGGLVGLGLTAAATRGHRRALTGGGVGAAVGLGYGLLKHGLN